MRYLNCSEKKKELKKYLESFFDKILHVKEESSSKLKLISKSKIKSKKAKKSNKKKSKNKNKTFKKSFFAF